MTRVALIGHSEWGTFARVDHVPQPGEIVTATETWADVGGAVVTAVGLASLAAGATLFTALGDDAHGARVRERLEGLGVTVEAVVRPRPHRRAFTHLDAAGERTITVFGEPLDPAGADPLPWARLAQADAVYLASGDADAARSARTARIVVTPPAGAAACLEAGVEPDVLVYSAHDPAESAIAEAFATPPKLTVSTLGAQGGTWRARDGGVGTWAATPLPGPVADAFGCGDSFAAGLTFGLARGDALADALALGARCGALCLTGRGPYERPLSNALAPAGAAQATH